MTVFALNGMSNNWDGNEMVRGTNDTPYFEQMKRQISSMSDKWADNQNTTSGVKCYDH